MVQRLRHVGNIEAWRDHVPLLGARNLRAANGILGLAGVRAVASGEGSQLRVRGWFAPLPVRVLTRTRRA